MKVITILASDGVEPSEVHIGDMNPREAAMICFEAYEALASEVSDMTVDRTVADWQP